MVENIHFKVAEIIGEFIDRAHEDPLYDINTPFEMDWIVDLITKSPQIDADNILTRYRKQNGSIPRLRVKRFMRKHHLYNEEERQKTVTDFALYSVELRKLLFSEELIPPPSTNEVKQSFVLLHTKILEQGHRTNPTNKYIVCRYLLRSISHEYQNSNTKDLKAIGQSIDEFLDLVTVRHAYDAVTRIIDMAGENRGFVSRDQSFDVQFQRLMSSLESVDDSYDSDNEDEDDEIDYLREENAHLRTSMIGLRHNVKDLKDQVHDLRESAHTDAVVELLRTMNSSQVGFLLDHVMFTGNQFRELLVSGWKPDPEMQVIPRLFNSLSSYFSKLGVTAMKEIGQQEYITINEANEISYQGSEFSNSQEEKLVEYKSPGWMYKNTIISRPKAQEIIESSEVNKQ